MEQRKGPGLTLPQSQHRARRLVVGGRRRLPAAGCSWPRLLGAPSLGHDAPLKDEHLDREDKFRFVLTPFK